jgi:putative hydroxymethylpyrimidine transport system permease protein
MTPHKTLAFLLSLLSIFALWQALVWGLQLPPYLLPTPLAVGKSLVHNAPLLALHTSTTLQEIFYGFGLGTGCGFGFAVILFSFPKIRPFFLPLLLISQALPVFALAPLLVLWAGYGMASKVIMASLIVFFPVTSALYDGLKNTPKAWVDLAHSVSGAKKWLILWRIHLPAALPSLGSGLKLAATFAPIGAVIGEWVGSGRGLGYLMLHANARMQIDLMFAALSILATITLSLYALASMFTRHFSHRQQEII